MYGVCWKIGKEEWAQICCAALTAWDGGGRWDISLSRLEGCRNERTRKSKATKACSQVFVLNLGHPLSPPELSCVSQHPGWWVSATLAHAHIQSSLQSMPCNEHPSSADWKTKETNQITSPRFHRLPSGKIVTIQIHLASRALEIWGCSGKEAGNVTKRGKGTTQKIRHNSSWQPHCPKPDFETQEWKLLLKRHHKLL